MFATLVMIHVKPEFVDAFIKATLKNVNSSLLEPGIVRFDFIRRKDDPTQFMLIEVYRNDEAPLLHKQTAHYAEWRDTVADMMAEPRQGIKYDWIAPAI